MSLSLAAVQRELEACTTYTLASVVRTQQLPVEVRVVKGFIGESEEDSVANGETLRIVSVRQDAAVKAHDHLKRKIEIPADCPAFFVDLGLNPSDPQNWQRLISSDPTQRKPVSLRRLLDMPLPLVTSLYQDYQSGNLSVSDMLVLTEVSRQEVVVMTSCAVTGIPTAEDLLSLPISADVEVVLLSELERNSRYASLWPQAEAEIQQLAVYRRLGTSADPSQQRRLERKLSTRGPAAKATSPTPDGRQEPSRRMTGASRGDRVKSPELPSRVSSAAQASKEFERSHSQGERGGAAAARRLASDPLPPGEYMQPVVGGGGIVAEEEYEYVPLSVQKKGLPKIYRQVSPAAQDAPAVPPRRSNSTGSAHGSSSLSPTPASPPPSRSPVSPSAAAGAGEGARERAMTTDVTPTTVASRVAGRIVGAITVFDVCCMLNELRMGQYCPAFEREQIDGSLLLMLDKKMLETDLGVQSKLHQLKIEQLISILKKNNT